MGQNESKGGHVLGGDGSAGGQHHRPHNHGNRQQQQQQQQQQQLHPVPERSSSAPRPSQPASSSQSAPGKSAGSDEDRAARLAAIEARMEASGKRGVQKTGGKLAQKLEESKKASNVANTATSPGRGGDDIAELWRTG
ncbi:hypothetical protein HK405_011154 [Cladochytrium tenue]|nr:hypothetical protein HK405_011154 [Cladochytrium tenue]